MHTLKWWLFTDISKRYTCGIPPSNNWIASYTRKKKIFQKENGKAPVCWIKHGEKNWHMMKGWHMKICWKNRTGTYTHYPYVFFNFSIFPFFINRRRFIVAVCFSFSINNSNLLELRDFQDISISQHLLNLVSEIQVSLLSVSFLGFIVSFFWISNFVFTL